MENDGPHSSYIPAARAVETLVASNFTLEQAHEALAVRLAEGNLRAFGVPDDRASFGIISRHSDSPFPPEHVPPAFWSTASADDRRAWNFVEGTARCSNPIIALKGGAYVYTELQLHKQDFRAILSKEGERARPGRPNSALLPEWVATLVTLYFEGKISGETRASRVHTLIAERMIAAGGEEPPQSTFAPTVRRVLEAIRESEKDGTT